MRRVFFITEQSVCLMMRMVNHMMHRMVPDMMHRMVPDMMMHRSRRMMRLAEADDRKKQQAGQ